MDLELIRNLFQADFDKSKILEKDKIRIIKNKDTKDKLGLF